MISIKSLLILVQKKPTFNRKDQKGQEGQESQEEARKARRVMPI